MSFLTDIEAMPTPGKIALAGAVVGVGVLGYVAFKKNSTSAASSGTTSGMTAGASPGAGAADQFTANGLTGVQQIENLINSKDIVTNDTKIEAELAQIEAELKNKKPGPTGPPVKATGSAHYTSTIHAIRVYHPLESATIASKRPYVSR
jgi:hypothetical protein